MPNPKNIPHGAVTITATDRSEYLDIIAQYEARGYKFNPCDDLKRLHWGALGFLNPGMPIVWVRLPILHVVGDADDDSRVGDQDETGLISEGTLHLGDRIEEVTTDLFDYHQAFNDHKERGHYLIEASDPLTYRLAFVCVTCARLVRVDWEQCIDLGIVLESSVKETENGID
jgi:hypothetical protein